jgi:hypothetical protein
VICKYIGNRKAGSLAKLASTVKTYETYFGAGTGGNRKGGGSRDRLLNQSSFFDLVRWNETIRILMAKSYHLAYNRTPINGTTVILR